MILWPYKEWEISLGVSHCAEIPKPGAVLLLKPPKKLHLVENVSLKLDDLTFGRLCWVHD